MIDEKKLYALVISKNVCMKTKKWWEDHNTLFETGEIPNEHNFLKLVYQNLIQKNNKYYIKTSYFSKLNYGRVYPTKLISQGIIIRRQLRHFLCKDLYFDIDIVNAHPNILRCVCKKFDIPCPYLQKYCRKRDKVLKYIMEQSGFDRDTTKSCIISLINGGKLVNYLMKYGARIEGDYSFLEKFQLEMEKVTEDLMDHNEEIKALYIELTKHKTQNKNGSFMAQYLQMYEYRLLELLYNAALEKN